MAGQRPRISIFNDPSSNNEIRRQQQEWDRVNTPLTPEIADYIFKETGGRFGRPENIGQAEMIHNALKAFAPPPSAGPKWGKVWSEEKQQYVVGDTNAPNTTLEPPVKEYKKRWNEATKTEEEYLVDPKTNYTGTTTKGPPDKFRPAAGPGGSSWDVNETTNKRDLVLPRAPINSDNIAAAKAKKLDDLSARYYDIMDRVSSLMGGVGITDVTKPELQADIEELRQQAAVISKQYDAAGGDLKDLGIKTANDIREEQRKQWKDLADQSDEEETPDEETDKPAPSGKSGDVFGGSKKEAPEPEDMSGVGKGDASVNTQKQRQLDAEKLTKANAKPVKGKSDVATIQGRRYQFNFGTGTWDSK